MNSGKESKKETVEDRSFKFEVNGKLCKFYLKMPHSEQIRKADWHYSKIYNKALIEGVATTSEMMDILTKRNIYGPDYEAKLQDLQVNIAIKIAEASNEEDPKVKAKLAVEAQTLRDELYRWNQRITGPLSNCCEQMADDAKTEYLTSVVIHDESGKIFWPDYDAFIAEESQALALRARFEVLLWLQGLDTDFLDKTPENQILSELAKNAADEKVAVAKAAAEEVKQLESGEEQPKKNITRKRASKKGKKQGV